MFPRTEISSGIQPLEPWPMWVDSAVLTFGRSLPVYPDERTFSESVGMSQKVESRMGAVAWAIRQRSVSHPTGSPEAVARPRLPQNVACGFSPRFNIRE